MAETLYPSRLCCSYHLLPHLCSPSIAMVARLKKRKKEWPPSLCVLWMNGIDMLNLNHNWASRCCVFNSDFLCTTHPIPCCSFSFIHFRKALVLATGFYTPVVMQASLNDPLDSSVCTVDKVIFLYLSWGAMHQQW